jgi:2-dehydro-3-deoxyglucarate aldolase/4-hydroxy-2-oxoheptanedioate aldolase
MTSTDGFRTRLRAGEPVVGGWVSVGHPAVAETTAGAGFDFVTIDTEHAAIGIETVEDLVRAVEAGGDAAPVVRVPSDDPVELKRVLDAGVEGVMVPRVDDGDEARAVVEATRYPPAGIRGTAAARASDYGATLAEYLETADDRIARILQVETQRAVAEAGAIADVDGVDALFVGPADLSAALDCHLDYDAPAFREAVGNVLDRAAAADTPVGVFATDPDRIEGWLSMGFEFAILGFDALYLREGNRERLAAFEAAVGDR